MARLTEFRFSRRAVGSIPLIAALALAACSDGTGTSPELPAPGPPVVEGPLSLEILAPDSSITERVLFPDLTYSYVCTLSLFAKLTGGERTSAIVWQSADVEWHWLSDNRFRNATVWPMEQLEVFWRSEALLTGQTRESLIWQFIGSQPYRLDFAFHYLVQGDDSLRTQDAAVRCVGPS